MTDGRARRRRVARVERRSTPINVAGTRYHHVTEFSVNEYHPEPDGKGPATQVHLWIRVARMPDPLVVRFKSPESLSHLIESLTVHRDSVWPPPPQKRGPR